MKRLMLLLLVLALASCSPLKEYTYIHSAVNVETPEQLSYEINGNISIYKNKVVIKDRNFKKTLKFDRTFESTVNDQFLEIYENEKCVFFIKKTGMKFACLSCAEKNYYFYFKDNVPNKYQQVYRADR